MSSNSFKSINTAFIKKFKKDNNIKVQTKLPSRVEADNAKAIAAGYSVIDATWFRRFMEEVKFDPIKYRRVMRMLFDMAEQCDCSPVGLVHFGRTTYGFKEFGGDQIVFLHEHMLADHDDGATQGVGEPQEEEVELDLRGDGDHDSPTSEEAYDIDDDDEAAFEAASRKRKVCTGDGEE